MPKNAKNHTTLKICTKLLRGARPSTILSLAWQRQRCLHIWYSKVPNWLLQNLGHRGSRSPSAGILYHEVRVVLRWSGRQTSTQQGSLRWRVLRHRQGDRSPRPLRQRQRRRSYGIWSKQPRCDGEHPAQRSRQRRNNRIPAQRVRVLSRFCTALLVGFQARRTLVEEATRHHLHCPNALIDNRRLPCNASVCVQEEATPAAWTISTTKETRHHETEVWQGYQTRSTQKTQVSNHRSSLMQANASKQSSFLVEASKCNKSKK